MHYSEKIAKLALRNPWNHDWVVVRLSFRCLPLAGREREHVAEHCSGVVESLLRDTKDSALDLQVSMSVTAWKEHIEE